MDFGKLSKKLMATLGKDFSKRSLEQYRKFYLSYNKITQALPAQSLKAIEREEEAFLNLSLKTGIPDSCD